MTDINLPNKCQYCGLRVRYAFRSADQSAESDKAFSELRALHAAGIIKPVYPRVVGMSNVSGNFGSTDFCAVASTAWQQNNKSCQHWALRIEGASVADYLSIHQDRKNYGIAFWGAVIAAALAVAIALAQAMI